LYKVLARIASDISDEGLRKLARYPRAEQAESEAGYKGLIKDLFYDIIDK
jgi:hypothetical protein